MNPIIVTVCSHPDHPGVARLKRSIEHHGWDSRHITLPWSGFRTKLIGVKSFAQEAKDLGYTHIIHLDAFDSLVLGNQKDLKRGLERAGFVGEALISTERACWPDSNREKDYPTTRKSPWCHINSGHYLVSVDYAAKLLEGCEECDDDQRLLTTKYLDDLKSDVPVVHRDDGCNVFQSLAHQHIWQNAFEIRGDDLYNHVTQTKVIFAHANGGGSSSNYHSWLPRFDTQYDKPEEEEPPIVSMTGWDYLYHSKLLNRSAWSNQPVPGEPQKLRELCRRVNPQTVVELGGRYGGTTLLLYDAAPKASIFAVDRKIIAEGDITVDWEAIKLSHQGYENQEYHTRRSWFKDAGVYFVQADFIKEHQRVKAIVDAKRKGRMFLFVDGDWGQKPIDAELYADWLKPGDVMALNNSHDIMDFTHAGNEWQIPEMEAMLLPKGYRRYDFDWCGDVGMMLTRAWEKI